MKEDTVVGIVVVVAAFVVVVAAAAAVVVVLKLPSYSHSLLPQHHSFSLFHYALV